MIKTLVILYCVAIGIGFPYSLGAENDISKSLTRREKGENWILFAFHLRFLYFSF